MIKVYFVEKILDFNTSQTISRFPLVMKKTILTNDTFRYICDMYIRNIYRHIYYIILKNVSDQSVFVLIPLCFTVIKKYEIIYDHTLLMSKTFPNKYLQYVSLRRALLNSYTLIYTIYLSKSFQNMNPYLNDRSHPYRANVKSKFTYYIRKVFLISCAIVGGPLFCTAGHFSHILRKLVSEISRILLRAGFCLRP